MAKAKATAKLRLYGLPIFVLLIALLAYLSWTLLSEDKTSVQHVVVVGGGAAGMSAAIELAEHGMAVSLFDKEFKVGGNSAKASSGINAAGTVAQRAAAIEDSFGIFQSDVIRSGKGEANEKLVDHLVRQSPNAISFLAEHGVNLGLLSHCGGHHVPRTHRSEFDPNAKFQRNIGSLITTALEAKLRSFPNVKIYTNSPVTKLMINEEKQRATGVEVNSTLVFDADHVILASGGFGRDLRLLNEFRPDYVNLPSTNGAWSNGDGIHMAREHEIALVGMEEVQVHPTGIINPNAPEESTKFLAAEAIRAGGAVLMNHEGKRFVNELGLRDEVTSAIFKNGKAQSETNPQIMAYMLLNENVLEAFGKSTMSFYQHKGFLVRFSNLSEFSSHYNIPNEQALESIRAYNAAKEAGVPDEFGKTRFPTSFDHTEPIYIFQITPSIHYTMGGVEIDEHARVLSRSGEVVKNLFAAGEVSGGVHGKNRLAGNSLLECVVYGRTAAASILSSQ